MAGRVSRFRLTSTAFKRNDEDQKIEPKRMIILSVEGDETERTYFEHLNTHLDHTLLQVEVLRHKRGDGYSDPRHVIELLNEYIDVREGNLIPSPLPESFTQKYSKEIIQTYLSNAKTLDAKTRNALRNDLLQIGIDLEYRRYLQTFDKELDYFAVILDRDCGNHSRELMEECSKLCLEKGYGYFITNPCFEFWLLLHLCNVKKEYDEAKLKEFLTNPKISAHHTVVSNEVSLRAAHGKRIGAKQFEQYYFPHIPEALVYVQQFATSYPDILDQLGSNLPQLFQILNAE